MTEIRGRVDTLVEDEETAQNLKAWYRQLCKRPCFHDEYLQAYNEPGTTLVDTDGKGVEQSDQERASSWPARSTSSTASSTLRASRSTRTRRAAMASMSPAPTGFQALRVLERRHAVTPRHPRPWLPEHVHRGGLPRGGPALQRASQLHRVRPDHRHDDPTRQGQGLQGDRGHPDSGG